MCLKRRFNKIHKLFSLHEKNSRTLWWYHNGVPPSGQHSHESVIGSQLIPDQTLDNT